MNPKESYLVLPLRDVHLGDCVTLRGMEGEAGLGMKQAGSGKARLES